MAQATANKETKGFMGRSKSFKDVETSSMAKKILKIVIFVIIFLLLTAFIVSVLLFNAFGIRDNHLRGVLSSIPIVNNVLPPIEEPVSEQQTMPETNQFALQNRITQLEGELAAANYELEDLQELNRINNATIVRLQEIEARQGQYSADREAFDRMIAEGDQVAFEAFFATMWPETAEEIYRSIVVQNVQDEEMRNYIATFENMNNNAASTLLVQMMQTELDLVIDIVDNLSVDRRQRILAAMDVENAAIIAIRLAPN